MGVSDYYFLKTRNRKFLYKIISVGTLIIPFPLMLSKGK